LTGVQQLLILVLAPASPEFLPVASKSGLFWPKQLVESLVLLYCKFERRGDHKSLTIAGTQMKVKEVVLGFLATAPIVLIVNLVVTYLYTLLAHGNGSLDWESSIRLGIIFGIALPLVRQLDKKKG
jgi:hypothetical protein